MNCLVQVVRREYTDTTTLGELYVDGTFVCFTLEDTDRYLTQDTPLDTILAKKKPGHTAIPIGAYKMAITYSSRFKKRLLIIKDVPGFTGIRFHTGNIPEDTDGCVLVGMEEENGALKDSRKAMTAFMGLIQNEKVIDLHVLRY